METQHLCTKAGVPGTMERSRCCTQHHAGFTVAHCAFVWGHSINLLPLWGAQLTSQTFSKDWWQSTASSPLSPRASEPWLGLVLVDWDWWTGTKTRNSLESWVGGLVNTVPAMPHGDQNSISRMNIQTSNKTDFSVTTHFNRPCTVQLGSGAVLINVP